MINKNVAALAALGVGFFSVTPMVQAAPSDCIRYFHWKYSIGE